MNLRKLLSRESIGVNLQGRTKEAVLEELLDLLVASGRVSNRRVALKAIQERERKMSTGMQNGIAIPHGKSDSVQQLAVAIGIHPAGIDFDAIDQQPTHFFVMTLSPANRTGPHIQFLAEISRRLTENGIAEKLLQATTPEDVLSVLAGDEHG